MNVLVFHHVCMVVPVLTDLVATCASVEGTGMDKTAKSVALATVSVALDLMLHAVSVNKVLFSPTEDVVSYNNIIILHACYEYVHVRSMSSIVCAEYNVTIHECNMNTLCVLKYPLLPRQLKWQH